MRQALAFDRFLDCDPVEEVAELAASFPPPSWQIEGIQVGTPAFGSAILAWSGGWDRAREAVGRYIEVARESGRLVAVLAAQGLLSNIERIAGRLADSEADARTAPEIAAGVLPFSPQVWQARLSLLATLVARGALEEAAAMAENIPASAGPRELPVVPWPIEVMGYLRLAEGDLEEAVHDLLALGEALETNRWFNPALPTWRQEAAPALAVLGRTAEAQELVAVADERARRFGAPHVIGTVLRARAALEPRKRQIETLREAVSALETYGPPHELARSLIDLGAALRREGQRSDARELLRRALELAHGCGAGGLEERAHEELAAAGGRRRRAARTGIAALTASELRTAKLAAEGLTNPEIAQRLFVTRRTVETHLTHVYEKLQLSGRADLKAALSEHAAFAG